MEMITDEILYKYVPIVDEMLIKEIEDQTNYEYEFSDDFNRKMKKLIFQEKHQVLYKFFRAPLKYVASVIVIIVASLFMVTMSVEANRIIFFERIQTIWEDSYLYKYFADEGNQIVLYEPEYIVEGYELINHIENDIVSLYEYYNVVTEQQYNLSQEMVTEGKKVVFDLSYDSKEVVNVGNCVVDIYRYQNGYVRAYTEYQEFIFTIDADNMTNEDLLKIYENWIQ